MGMFDEIRCEVPLPDGWEPHDEWFQTKTFPSPCLQRYTITKHGRLLDAAGNDVEPDGYISFYTHDRDDHWREYRAHFREGDLCEIAVVAVDAGDRRVYGLASFRWFDAPSFMFDDDDERLTPTPPVMPAPSTYPSLPEKAQRETQLLTAIKVALPALEKLMERANSHWGYEDPVYRLYHGSFKVFALQHFTTEIAFALRELLPDVELNEMFLTVIQDGSGKSFTPESNSRWLVETRPIVEAFFHARFFLEMAIRYGRELELPPRVLPSGWAALLYLYKLR